MINNQLKNKYDAIIVGSGVCGATIARELSKQNKKVLLLERGKTRPLKESLFNIISISDTVSLGNKLMVMRGLTTGGSTALYFGVADLPPIAVFKKLGIDLTKELEEIRKEIPIAELPDKLIGPQSLILREAASKLGYEWKKKLMLIDQSKCKSGYSYDAKWKARSYVDQAIKNGVTLLNRSTVKRVIVENNKAIGVEYQVSKKRTEKAYASKIILAAGSAATPIILRESGLKNIVDNGFFIDPSCALFGIIPKLKAIDNFMGNMSMEYEDDIMIGDLNATKRFFRMLMLANSKPQRFFSFSNSVGVGVKVKDTCGGELRKDNTYYKEITNEDRIKLKIGQEKAHKVLESAGATKIFKTSFGATDLGRTVTIQRHVDKNLETEYKNLYVCDGSLIPNEARISPTLTLLCLAKYLSKNIFSNA